MGLLDEGRVMGKKSKVLTAKIYLNIATCIGLL